MTILPRSNPLYENIPVQSLNLPEAIKKLGSGGFTGYLSYNSTAAEGYFIFIKGALISSLVVRQSDRKTGFEAISSLFEHVIRDAGIINVYLMTPDVAISTHALLHGALLAGPAQVAGIDLMALLGQMKTNQADGTVLFRTPERSAMIFYKAGAPIGFYHDGAKEIERSPAESQKVASLPGASVEIRIVSDVATIMHHNFLETLNIDKLWQSLLLRANQTTPLKPETEEPLVCDPPPETSPVKEASPDPILLKEILEDLKEIAKAYLGRRGAELVESQLEATGGPSILYTSPAVDQFLQAITAEAPAIDPEARIEEMTDLMKSEITGRLSIS